MHLLATTSATLDDLAEPVDLRQAPAAMVALSFTDSDLAGLAAAWEAERDGLPDLRLAHLRDLRHPMSVDLWIDRVGSHAKVIVVRLLGGLDWWRYGAERLAATARERGIRLAVLPGEDRDDPRLFELSTLPAAELQALLAYFRAGGQDNMRRLLRRLANHAGADYPIVDAAPVPQAGFYLPGEGVLAWADLRQRPSFRSLPEAAGRNPWTGSDLHRERMDSDRTAMDSGLALRAPRNDTKKPAAVVPILFYRSMLLADDAAPIDALAEALGRRGLEPLPIFVASLKDAVSLAFVREAFFTFHPEVIVTTTAFASGAAPGESPFEDCDAPVLQAIVATTQRAAWEGSDRGLAAADLAMHVVLPELDGRVLAGALAFKDRAAPRDHLGFTGLVNRPEPDRIEQVADRVAALVRLRRTPRHERRIAVVMPDYPGATGRAGYAVGLDVPASVRTLLIDLAEAGYDVANIPEGERALLDSLDESSGGATTTPSPLGGEGWGEGACVQTSNSSSSASASAPHPTLRVDLSPTQVGSIRLAQSVCGTREFPSSDAGRGELALPHYEALLSRLPPPFVASLKAAWGEPASDPDVHDGAFRFRAACFGNILVALPPDRGRSIERRADYHDPALPPRHALVAFGLWLRHRAGVHALVHMGAHGTLEWLPGKAVALTQACAPEAVVGALPVVYPFIVSNPGEAAQAKRRIAAVTIGHLPPPLVEAGLSGPLRDLERLVDEFAQADGLDQRRRERLAGLIVTTAKDAGLLAETGIAPDSPPEEALRRIDAWLCDIKEAAIKDGLHIFGQGPCGREEREALMAALDGKAIPAGPAGAPARGRTDVLPTGRNLFTADPRTLPTPTAVDLGRLAADEVVRAYLQEHGDWPRSLVVDLWGSATLRTGGEEIAEGLALMGCKPRWDGATGRVTGIEALPTAVVGRPRIDVTWRVSGLFRDLFPAQLALLDTAVRTVAARDETAEDNPLAAACSGEGEVPSRIFGTAPGAYGAGIEEQLASGRWTTRDELGRAYLSAASHAYGGADGEGRAEPEAFAARVATADALIHSGDDPGRDLLEGSADVGFVGGFAAAAESLGRRPELFMLDTTAPGRPTARRLDAALARLVRARVINPTFIAGQMRHGPRGAAELTETVDRLVAFAETTGAVTSALLDLVHDAYLGDAAVRAFLLRENPQAARAMAERFADARRRGLWHPRRNDLDHDLDEVKAEAIRGSAIRAGEVGT